MTPERNERRIALIMQRSQGLSTDESEELAELQSEAEAWIDGVENLPIDALRRLHDEVMGKYDRNEHTDCYRSLGNL